MTKKQLPILLAALSALSALWGACDEPPPPKERPTFEDDAGADAGERVGPQFAAVSSDYMSSAVSLLGVDGTLLADDYLNSGSVEPGLVTFLSGDLELPTRSNDPGVLVLIDRFKTDVITRLRLSDGKILGQVKTHTPSEQESDSAYTSNPHDYIRIDDETAWVTRNQPNLDPNVPEIDRGNDLLRINPSKMERSDERIDFSQFNTKVKRINFMTKQEEEVDIYAKPSRMTRLGDTLVVGMMRNAFDFSANAAGMVALVNLTTRAVSGVALPDGFIGCTKVSPIPGDDERVLVTCGGDYLDVRGTAGFAILRVKNGAATLEESWYAKEHTDLPALSDCVTSLGGTLLTAAAISYVPEEDSVFGVLDLATGEFRELLSIPGGPDTFGTPVYDAEGRLLIVPDASQDGDMRPTAGLHLLKRDGDDFEEESVLPVADDTALPVRHVYPL